MTKIIANTYSSVNDNKIYVTSAILAACGILVMIYAFNVYKLVSRTVAIESIQTQINSESSSVNSLAVEYLSLSSELTPDTMKSFGMSEGTVSEYISKTASLGRVALGGSNM